MNVFSKHTNKHTYTSKLNKIKHSVQSTFGSILSCGRGVYETETVKLYEQINRKPHNYIKRLA